MLVCTDGALQTIGLLHKAPELDRDRSAKAKQGSFREQISRAPEKTAPAPQRSYPAGSAPSLRSPCIWPLRSPFPTSENADIPRVQYLWRLCSDLVRDRFQKGRGSRGLGRARRRSFRTPREQHVAS